MGVSTDAQISFGVMFPEGYEFPWEKDEYDWDTNIWWKTIKKEGRCPVELVNYCSCEYPMYILAVPRTVITANRGYAIPFDLDDLDVSEDEIEALLDFCRENNLEFEKGPSWFLSSIWC